MAKQIKSRLRQLRLALAVRLGRPVAIREVSRATGIAVSTLRRIEEDRAQGVDFSTLTTLAEYYGVSSLDDLLQMIDEWLSLCLAPS